jgi:hypothetical protein
MFAGFDMEGLTVTGFTLIEVAASAHASRPPL